MEGYLSVALKEAQDNYVRFRMLEKKIKTRSFFKIEEHRKPRSACSLLKWW